MTMDEVMAKVQYLNSEKPDFGDYQQMLRDSFVVAWELAKAVKALQEEVGALTAKKET